MKLIREHINEFERGDNSLKNLGIGTRVLISNFMKKIGEKDTDDNALAECGARGKTEWVEYLLKNGADVNAFYGFALRLASEKGYIEIVKLLLDAGADVHVYDGDALRRASEEGHVEIVKLLLDAGANPNLIKESLGFYRDGSPLVNIGVGHMYLIKKWLSDYGITNYKINEDYSLLID
jgi:ankyrin repeat protein